MYLTYCNSNINIAIINVAVIINYILTIIHTYIIILCKCVCVCVCVCVRARARARAYCYICRLISFPKIKEIENKINVTENWLKRSIELINASSFVQFHAFRYWSSRCYIYSRSNLSI